MLQITQTCDTASILFNLEGHVVLSAERSGADRAVLVEPVEREGACPDCGVGRPCVLVGCGWEGLFRWRPPP